MPIKSRNVSYLILKIEKKQIGIKLPLAETLMERENELQKVAPNKQWLKSDIWMGNGWNIHV